MKERYAAFIQRVREKKPLVHHITNYVSVNDCANITLAISASPIMADALEEAADIARISSAVVLNMGTLNERTIPSMLAAGKAANQAGVPVVFDPVGAGASQLRNQTAARLLDEVKIGVLRGNISEIRFLAGRQSETKGVDASEDDLQNTEDAVTVAKTLAVRLHCVTAITGAVDIVSDGKVVVCIENGHPMLSNLTGTGCMCSSLIGSFCGAAPDATFEATVAALLSMSIAGEIAFEKAGHAGNGSFRMALHDAVSHMNAETLTGRAKIHEA
ncbi:MAG TPA: hydroxyethylthiazole kinase [Clostridiales bacterium]|jgi:hydroxyethylthiazole kinase|nr:hydroxyethylthiazole kinase [Clostridiales bacterium]